MLCKTRLTASILLLVLLTTTSAQALPFGARQAPASHHESFIEALWNRLLALIGQPEPAPDRPGQPTPSQEKEGPQMDPNGGK